MNRIKNISILFLGVFIFVNIANLSATEKRRFIVVVDAGHGGKDPGAIGSSLKIKEKDVNLAVALELGKLLYEEPGVRIVFTRKKDIFVPLDERAKIANNEKADLFISIHANAAKSRSAYGTETYVVGASSKENMEVAMRENSSILLEDNYKSRYDGFDPNKSESYIMFDMIQSTYLYQSINLAQNIQNQFVKSCNRTDRGVKQAGFLVLRQTSMPSVLIELGYVTNAKEEKYLSQEKNQKKLAKSIFAAVIKYKESIEQKSIAEENEKKSQISEKNEQYEKSVSSDSNEKVEKNLNEKVSLESDSTIYYSIQFCTSKTKIVPNSSLFKSCKPAIEYLENTVYKYMYGKVINYSEAIDLQKKVRKEFPDAFMVVFKGTKKLSSVEAVKYMK